MDGKANPLMDRKVVGVVFLFAFAFHAADTHFFWPDGICCSAVLAVGYGTEFAHEVANQEASKDSSSWKLWSKVVQGWQVGCKMNNTKRGPTRPSLDPAFTCIEHSSQSKHHLSYMSSTLVICNHRSYSWHTLLLTRWDLLLSRFPQLHFDWEPNPWQCFLCIFWNICKSKHSQGFTLTTRKRIGNIAAKWANSGNPTQRTHMCFNLSKILSHRSSTVEFSDMPFMRLNFVPSLST